MARKLKRKKKRPAGYLLPQTVTVVCPVCDEMVTETWTFINKQPVEKLEQLTLVTHRQQTGCPLILIVKKTVKRYALRCTVCDTMWDIQKTKMNKQIGVICRNPQCSMRDDYPRMEKHYREKRYKMTRG